ncbi:MAG: Crp/Fnr family transcriptional regulator [Epulopiscium sp.]|nr:Crp/Fnr family transcriptional regulator [Candidatus Epulonipiscium sp.]
MRQALPFLLSLDLFNDFQQQELLSLLETNSEIKIYERNQIIYIQNEKAYSMDIILEGEVIVQRIDEKGNILSIIILGKGDMLGGNLIFSHKNEYPMTIISQTHTRILRLKKNLVLELCQKKKEFLEKFLETLSDKALVLTDKIHSLAQKTIREKITDFLLYEYRQQNSSVIQLPMTKKELAEKLGVERPSLQRELKKMRLEGLLSYDARTITILASEIL